MLTKPKKPKYYRALWFGIFTVGIGIVIVFRTLGLNTDLNYDSLIFALVMFLMFYIMNNLLFSKYHQEMQDYNEARYQADFQKREDIKAEEEQERLRHSQVNESIRRALDTQRTRKANAKPWQFWV